MRTKPMEDSPGERKYLRSQEKTFNNDEDDD